MRKCTILLLTLMMILFIAACEDDSSIESDVDLTTYLDTVELPENLTISFDPSKVELHQSAKVYREISKLAIDVELAKDKLLTSEIIEFDQQAFGPWFRAGDDKVPEILIVHDGGQGYFGEQKHELGGLNYSALPSDFHNKPSLITSKVGPPDTSEQVRQSKSRSQYSSFTDLPFMSYEEAKDSILTLLSSVGFPELEVAESYSMDLASIQANYAEYLKESESRNEIDGPMITKWTAEDEQYLFHFRQLIDEIPITNRTWLWAKGTNTGAAGSRGGETTISVTVNQNGISTIHALGIFDLSTATVDEEETLIDVTQALQLLVDEYSLLILEDETKITGAELLYVSTPEHDTFELTPAWVFTVAQPSIWKDHIIEKDIPIKSFNFYVVNAITGEKMSGMR